VARWGSSLVRLTNRGSGLAPYEAITNDDKHASSRVCFKRFNMIFPFGK